MNRNLSLLEQRIRKLKIVNTIILVIYLTGIVLGLIYLPPPSELSILWQVAIWSAFIVFGVIYLFIGFRLNRLQTKP